MTRQETKLHVVEESSGGDYKVSDQELELYGVRDIRRAAAQDEKFAPKLGTLITVELRTGARFMGNLRKVTERDVILQAEGTTMMMSISRVDIITLWWNAT